MFATILCSLLLSQTFPLTQQDQYEESREDARRYERQQEIRKQEDEQYRIRREEQARQEKRLRPDHH